MPLPKFEAGHPSIKIVIRHLQIAIEAGARAITFINAHHTQPPKVIVMEDGVELEPRTPMTWEKGSLLLKMLAEYASKKNLVGTFTYTAYQNTGDQPPNEEQWEVKFHEYPKGDLWAQLMKLTQQADRPIEQALNHKQNSARS